MSRTIECDTIKRCLFSGVSISPIILCVYVCVCVCVSEESLLQGSVKGMKKFYNYLKREDERGRWEETANMEDVEFLECQEEMNEQLFEQYTLVERVIGKSELA